MNSVLSFLFISFVVSFTSTTIKQDDFKSILKSGTYLFLLMSLGIIGFCALLHMLSLWF